MFSFLNGKDRNVLNRKERGAQSCYIVHHLQSINLYKLPLNLSMPGIKEGSVGTCRLPQQGTRMLPILYLTISPSIYISYLWTCPCQERRAALGTCRLPQQGTRMLPVVPHKSINLYSYLWTCPCQERRAAWAHADYHIRVPGCCLLYHINQSIYLSYLWTCPCQERRAAWVHADYHSRTPGCCLLWHTVHQPLWKLYPKYLN